MNKYFKHVSLALSLMLCFSAVAFGQGTAGSIEGTVADQTGALIPGASVKVESTGTTTGFSRTITANEQGYFLFARVAPGTYKVTYEATGFGSVTRNVTVVLDKAANASTQLKPAGSETTVVVSTDSAVTIDIGDTKIDTNITKEIIDALPKGTTFGSLLKIAPNVRPEALSGGFQIDGASGSENVFVVDGQEVTNFRTGVLNSNNNLPFELLQEVQVKSTGFEAEYGGATGGVINAVTAGGNNAWHGNFGASFKPSKLQGEPTTVLNAYGTTAGQFEQFNRKKDGGTDFFPVASFSGPIVKNRLWGLVSYAPQIIETNRTIDYFSNNTPTRTVVTSEKYDQKFKTEQMFARLDAQPTSRLRLFGTFLYNPIIQDGSLPGTTAGLATTGPTQSVSTWATQGGRQNSNSINGQASYTPTNWIVLNFRSGRSFLNEKLGSYAIPTGTRFRCIVGNNVDCASGFSNIPTNFSNARDVSTRTTFDGDASFVGINAGGRHNIKVGYQYNRLFNDVLQGYPVDGEVRIWYGLNITNFIGTRAGPADPTAIGAGYFQRFGTVGKAKSTNNAIFAQDSWQIGNRLTLNFGIRIEKEIVPSFGAPQSTNNIEFGWGDKPAPRFGIAYDLTGDGKTKLFGSYGWFYDRFKYELPRGSFGGDFFRRDYFEVLPSRSRSPLFYTSARVLGGRADSVGGTCPIATPTPGFSRCQNDFRIATNSTTADIFSTGAVDPNIKAARQSEYTVGLERILGRNMLMAARYTHKQVDVAVEDVGVLNNQGSEAYIIGNPGLGLVCEISSSANQPCTKAIREYDAFEIRLDKRSNNYFYNMSYTLSRLFGNYSGLASSDEAGRTSPNVNRFFDLPMLGYNANGVPDDGRLATDRPHVFKAYGGYSWDWAGDSSNRTSISAFTTIQSGTPMTSIYTLLHVGTAILYGRGDLGRTEMFSETDFSVSHKYKFGRDNRFTLEPFIEIRNLFDENNRLTQQNSVSGTDFAASTLTANGCTTCATDLAVFNTIFNGGGIQRFVTNFLAAQPISASGNSNTYKQPTSFQAGRDVRFGFRVNF